MNFFARAELQLTNFNLLSFLRSALYTENFFNYYPAPNHLRSLKGHFGNKNNFVDTFRYLYLSHKQAPGTRRHEIVTRISIQ